MWFRRTVEAIRDNPPVFKKPKGPTGRRQRKSQELEQRIRELLHQPGPRLSNPDIAERLGVHVNTVFNHRTRIEAAEQAAAPASE
jgi:DNA-binding NarL/FixJ family response regulator